MNKGNAVVVVNRPVAMLLANSYGWMQQLGTLTVLAQPPQSRPYSSTLH